MPQSAHINRRCSDHCDLPGLASIDKRPNLHYDLVNPETEINYGCPEKGWRYSPETMHELIDEGKVIWPSNPKGRPRRKKFLSELQSQFTGLSSLLRDVSTTSAGTQEIRELFGTDVFDFPKPLELVKVLIDQGSSDDDIVLDFFAGSCPSAQAVLELNQEDGGDRRFIVVQLPEQTAENSPARESGYETIADIGKERIRRVIANMEAESPAQEMKLAESPAPEPQLAMALDAPSEEENYATRNTHYAPGFKAFKLAPSTFRRWETTIEIEVDEDEDEDEPQDRADPEAGEDLRAQLSYFDAGLKDDFEIAHVLYEVLLKLGFSLNCAVEPLPIPANTVYHIAQPPEEATGLDECYICLDEQIVIPTLDALPLTRETYFICLDTALSDAIKLNLALQCELRVV